MDKKTILFFGGSGSLGNEFITNYGETNKIINKIFNLKIKIKYFTSILI